MTLFSIFQKDKNIKGFSLVELMVVMGIAGILMTVASSMFTDYRKNLRLREAATVFMTDIKLAKQRATAENVPYKCAFNHGDDTLYTFGQFVAGNVTNVVARNLHNISPDISFRRVSSSESDNGFIMQPRGTSTQGFVVLQNSKKKIRIDITTTGRMTINQNYVE